MISRISLDELSESLFTSTLHPVNLCSVLEHDECWHVFDVMLRGNKVTFVRIDEIKLHVGVLHGKSIEDRPDALARSLVGSEINYDRCVVR